MSIPRLRKHNGFVLVDRQQIVASFFVIKDEQIFGPSLRSSTDVECSADCSDCAIS